MESKNIKVIDEHGIDRSANIICAIDVDGSDYAIYWIERDSDNDNIFISKLLKNIDGTSSMINIEDSMEKNKMADIVKELIKFSIENDASSVQGNSVSLPSGKVVGMSSVLINKEQYINVQKTYITTVKKSVTKVSVDYYKVNNKVESEPTPVVDVFPTVEPALPELNVVEPVVETVTTVVEPAAPVAPATPVEPIQVAEPVIEPTIATIPNVVESTPVIAAEPVVSATVVPSVPVEPAVETVVPEPISQVESVSVAAPVIEPVVAPSEPGQLIFDASKENNLNMALGEVSSETKISSTDVSSIREFGQEEPIPASVAPTPVVSNESASAPSNGQSGFANNKFFMFIAIAFFMASCVFLGYEVFNYFQLVK